MEQNPGPVTPCTCPFGAPCTFSTKGADAIRAHVNSVHLSVKQIPPLPWAMKGGYWVCGRCLLLVKLGSKCASLQCFPQLLLDSAYTAISPPLIPTPVAPPALPPPIPDPYLAPLEGPEPPVGPSLDEILSSHIPTFDRIPTKARRSVTDSFTDTLGNLLSRPSWGSLRAFFAWPKIVLRAPGIEGKGQLHHNVSVILNQLEAFSTQPLHNCWQPKLDQPARSTRSSSARRAQEMPPGKRKRIRQLVSEGQTGQAYRILTSTGTHSLADPRVLQCLKDLHPSEDAIKRVPVPDVHVLKFATEPDALRLRHDTLRLCIKAFGVTSAPGPSGLKAAHLQDMLATKQTLQQEKILQVLDDLVCRALTGQLHQRLATALGCARLIALRKDKAPNVDPDSEEDETMEPPEDDVPSKKNIRPIAIGETLRRLIGKVAMDLPQTKAVTRSLHYNKPTSHYNKVWGQNEEQSKQQC